jgi:cytoplasmic tRNA 2-thiolation protein 1
VTELSFSGGFGGPCSDKGTVPSVFPPLVSLGSDNSRCQRTDSRAKTNNSTSSKIRKDQFSSDPQLQSIPLQSIEKVSAQKVAPKPNCRCGAKAVYFRAYNGESLCAKCFSSSILEKTKKTISKYGMLNFGDSVAVAISGGKDSSSLLYVLNEIMKGHGSKLQALTVDEGINGYRDESVKNAKELAEKLSIPLLVSSYEEFFGFTLDDALEQRIDKGISITSCAVCGPLRRRSIDNAAKALGANVVATAHNLDDVLQTFFINLHSGDAERIKWLSPVYRQSSENFKLRRIKPFLEIYEQELAFFAYTNDLPFQSESCPYMNEGIRTEIRTYLNELEQRHPGTKYSTLRTALQIANGLEGLLAKKEIRTCSKCGSVSTGEVCSVCKTIVQFQ